MKIYETEINGYTVELIDVEDAMAPTDVCLIRVTDANGKTTDETFVNISKAGHIRTMF